MTFTRRKFILASGATIITAPGVANIIAGEPGLETDLDRDESLWTQSLSGSPAYSSFQGEGEADLVIVGGGYTGLSCAFYAKQFRPEWRVVVLEAQEIGSGSSSRNSGAVYARYVGIENQAMADRGLQRLRSFIDQRAIDCDFQPASTLFLHRSERSAKKAQNDMDPGATWITGQQINELAGTDYYAGAVDSPGYFKIDPAKLLLGKSSAAKSIGVEIYEQSAVTNIEQGTPAIVSTKAGTLTANNVMIATNGYTPRLGLMKYSMFPLHQFTLGTRVLSHSEIQSLGLDQWDLRFEPRILPVTFSLAPSGHFFMRMVLGYAHNDSSHWRDTRGALETAKMMFLQRYPGMADIGFKHHWHGITGHTVTQQPIMGAVGEGNVHVSVAYNGLGIMPAHNNGYLSACKITGREDQDVAILDTIGRQVPVPRGFYRSAMFKPAFNALMPI